VVSAVGDEDCTVGANRDTGGVIELGCGAGAVSIALVNKRMGEIGTFSVRVRM